MTPGAGEVEAGMHTVPVCLLPAAVRGPLAASKGQHVPLSRLSQRPFCRSSRPCACCPIKVQNYHRGRACSCQLHGPIQHERRGEWCAKLWLVGSRALSSCCCGARSLCTHSLARHTCGNAGAPQAVHSEARGVAARALHSNVRRLPVPGVSGAKRGACRPNGRGSRCAILPL